MTSETKPKPTTAEEIAKALAAPFHPFDIEWRIGQAGTKESRGEVTVWAKCLAYVTNRAIMHRLDEVVGIGNWKNEYRPWIVAKDLKGREIFSQICTLSLRIDGEWIAKEDGADCSEMEPIKGGLSDSMKRAAYQWGIGRYLYDLESDFAKTALKRPDDGGDWRFARTNEKDKQSVAYFWQPPTLPDWALPLDMRKEKPETKPTAPPADPPKQKPADKPLSNAEMARQMDERRKLSVTLADKLQARAEQVEAFADLEVAEKYVCEQFDAGKLHEHDFRRVLVAILDRRISICESPADIDETEAQFASLQQRKWLLEAQAEAFGERLEAKRAKLAEEAPL